MHLGRRIICEQECDIMVHDTFAFRMNCDFGFTRILTVT